MYYFLFFIFILLCCFYILYCETGGLLTAVICTERLALITNERHLMWFNVEGLVRWIGFILFDFQFVWSVSSCRCIYLQVYVYSKDCSIIVITFITIIVPTHQRLFFLFFCIMGHKYFQTNEQTNICLHKNCTTHKLSKRKKKN